MTNKLVSAYSLACTESFVSHAETQINDNAVNDNPPEGIVTPCYGRTSQKTNYVVI